MTVTASVTASTVYVLSKKSRHSAVCAVWGVIMINDDWLKRTAK